MKQLAEHRLLLRPFYICNFNLSTVNNRVQPSILLTARPRMNTLYTSANDPVSLLATTLLLYITRLIRLFSYVKRISYYWICAPSWYYSSASTKTANMIVST